MKRVILIGCLTALVLSANAQIRVPGSVHTLEELGEAKAEAAKEKKPLVFVLTNPEST